jgi:hypothetical protein
LSRRGPGVAQRQGLKPDSLRLWHLVAVGLAFQSLALVVYLNVGFIEQTAGPVAPVVFLLVTLASIPTAISFAVMSNRRPSAGTAFTWMRRRRALAPLHRWLTDNVQTPRTHNGPTDDGGFVVGPRSRS